MEFNIIADYYSFVGSSIYDQGSGDEAYLHGTYLEPIWYEAYTLAIL